MMYYHVEIECANCGKSTWVSVDVGTRVEDCPNLTVCSYCGHNGFGVLLTTSCNVMFNYVSRMDTFYVYPPSPVVHTGEYGAKVYCGNCGAQRTVYIPKGITIKKFGETLICYHCECIGIVTG